MTTGTDLPSSVQLPAWLSRNGADLLKTNPIVAVDRRGIGMSGELDCRDVFDRQEMLDQAQFESGNDPVANLAAVVQTATTSCTDTIAPGDSSYDNARAAEDIERLRSTWDVPTLALLGIGNGAQVALAYAGTHPNKLVQADPRLAAAAGRLRGGGRRTEGQGPAGRAGRVRLAMRRVGVPTRARSQGRHRLDAVRRQGGPRPRRRVRRHPRGRHHHRARVSLAATASAATNDLATTLAAARGGDTTQLNALISRAEIVAPNRRPVRQLLQ